MKEVEVIGNAATFPEGTILFLNEDQFFRRKHAVKLIGKGKYLVSMPVQFKRGEKFGLDGEINKVMAQVIKQTDKKEAR